MKPWLIVNNAADNTEILIQGSIGATWWDESGTGEKQFTDALAEIPEGRKITIGINSEGGSIKDGLGIYSAIKRRAKDITSRVDGFALSIASIVALGAGKVVSPKSAVWMIHDARMATYGDAEEHRKAIEALDKFSESLVAIYEEETGQKPEAIRAAMKAETWFRGDEAVAWGLADELSDENPALNAIDLTKFHNIPKPILRELAAAQGANTGSASKPPQPKVTPMNPTLVAEPTAPPITASPQASASPPPPANPPPPSVDMSEVITELRAIRAALPPQRPAIPPGAEPLNIGARAVTVGDADDLLLPMPKGLERRRFITNAWSEIRLARERKSPEEARKNPTNVSTIAAALTTDLLSQTVIMTMQNRLAPLTALFLQVEQDPVKPMATIQVPHVTVGTTAITDPTDWEVGNNTAVAVAITMHEYATPWTMTNVQLQNGSQMAWFAEINAIAFCNAIVDAFTALLTAAYTNTAITSSFAAFGANERTALWASAKNFILRNLVVDGEYWARMLPANTTNFTISQGSPAYGFDGIWYSNRWGAALANVRGFVASPAAAVCVAGLPLEPPGANVQFSSLNSQIIEPLGISVQVSSWFKPGTRVQWQAYDMMFGCNRGDVTQLTLLKIA